MATARSHIMAHTTWVALMDLVCLILGCMIGVLVRFGSEDISEYVFQHFEGWLLLIGSVLLANYVAGGYRLQYTFSRFNLVVTWAFSLAFALLVLSITSYAWFSYLLGRGVLFLSLASYSVLSLFLKLLVYRSLFRSQVFLCRTVVLGAGARAREIRRTLESEFVLPAHKVVAFVRIANGVKLPESPGVLDGVAVIDSTSKDLEGIVRSLGAGLVVIGTDDLSASSRFYPHLKRLRFDGVEVLTPLNVAEIYGGRTPLELVNEEFLMRASLESELPMIRRVKRLVDICVSLLALLVFLPLSILIALLIKLSAPRQPVFYVQQRVGRFGKPFTIFKFRTMRPGAEADSGPVWSSDSDPRITWIGRILRRMRLDEIPQFVNILRGDMSLVGPRPERPEISHQLQESIPYFEERENIMPGLTGWAQIRHRYGNTIEDAARKLEYDLYYLKHQSLSLDLQILLSTVRIVVFGAEK